MDRFTGTTTLAKPRKMVSGRPMLMLMLMLAGFSIVVALACWAYFAQAHTSSGRQWTKVWTDDFNGPARAGIDANKWMFDTGQGVFGTREIETMTASRSNIYLDGHGNLDIVVRGHGAPGQPDSAWTSGRIQTKRLFAPPPGGEMMVTASIRQPDPAHGLGYWPAFWMLGPKAWPMDGEIDILEEINGLDEHSGTLHCGNLTQRNSDGTFGPCHETDGLGSGPRPCPGCQRAFHTYSVVVDRRAAARQQVRWYFDGREFYSVSESAVGRVAWNAAIDHGFSIILNVAVGGAYPDIVCKCVTPTDQTSSQAAMTVKYVAVYTS